MMEMLFKMDVLLDSAALFWQRTKDVNSALAWRSRASFSSSRGVPSFSLTDAMQSAALSFSFVAKTLDSRIGYILRRILDKCWQHWRQSCWSCCRRSAVDEFECSLTKNCRSNKKLLQHLQSLKKSKHNCRQCKESPEMKKKSSPTVSKTFAQK